MFWIKVLVLVVTKTAGDVTQAALSSPPPAETWSQQYWPLTSTFVASVCLILYSVCINLMMCVDTVTDELILTCRHCEHHCVHVSAKPVAAAREQHVLIQCGRLQEADASDIWVMSACCQHIVSAANVQTD